MSPEDQDKNLAAILGDYPNTYTYTKALAERTLMKRRNPNLPVVIIRPSIIIGAMAEPVPGWTDTFSAAGGLTLAGGIGIVNYVNGNGNNIADLVPVDYVSNIIIAATALNARKPDLKVFHIATSH
jgi:nucleoside-diphosphate-sugar epimerase